MYTYVYIYTHINIYDGGTSKQQYQIFGYLIYYTQYSD